MQCVRLTILILYYYSIDVNRFRAFCSLTIAKIVQNIITAKHCR